MSRRKQAKPRSLKRDEEWDDGTEQGAPESFEEGSDLDTIKPENEDEEDDDEEEEELQRAFSIHSEEYLRDGGSRSVQDPDLENQNSLDSDALGTGSSSWHSEDGGTNSRRGVETPSSCATPTSASFPSEPEVENEVGVNADGNNPAAPYPCQFCDRTFPRLSYLKKHEQSHGDQMPYRCSWCSRLFKHKRSRDRHVKLHTGDRRYRCSHCEAAFSRSDHLKIHMKTHDNQKPYQCTACSRGYNTAAALTSHMQSHKKHPSPNQSTKLDIDYGRRSVSSHSTSSPPIQNSPSPRSNPGVYVKNSSKCQRSIYENSNPPKAPLLSSPLKLACMYCTKDSFTSMQQLQLHVRAMHQAILNGESIRGESAERTKPEGMNSMCREREIEERRSANDYERGCHRERREMSVEREKLLDNDFSCGQCTMKFGNVSELRDHLVTIHRNEGFGGTLMMCPLCGIPCSTAASYAEHYVLKHCENGRETTKDTANRVDWTASKTNVSREDSRSNSNDHSAGIRSDLVTSEPADLTKKHSLPIDTGYTTGTLLCGQCGAALKDFESFREHLARHLQADQQSSEVSTRRSCPKCGTNFADSEDMLAHLTKHYIGQVTKEYTCVACKKFYPHPDLLQRHLLDAHAHHLYRCAVCRDTFDSRVAIQVHFAVKHSQECQIYRCNVCNVTSNDNSSDGSTNEGKNYFRSEAEMANHVRTIHAPSMMSNESPVRRSPAPTPVANPIAARCVFCGICCNTDLELQIHLASHSTSLYRCPICREGFPVEFLLERHMAQAHRPNGERNDSRDNGRIYRASRSQDDTTRSQKRGRSPASSNNNSLNQRDNNNKRLNYGGTNGTTVKTVVQHCELCERAEFASEAELQAHKKLVHTPTKLQSKSLTLLSMTCAYCGDVCRSRSDLESHTRIQHAANEPGGRHKCNICDEVCPSGGILAEHKLQKHCKIQLSDTCVVCRGNLTTEAQFIEHVQRHSHECGETQQQRLDNGPPILPAACVVCRQTLITDLECRLHASHHLRGTNDTHVSNAAPSPTRQTVQQQQQQQQTLRQASLSCCLCLREFSADDFVSLPANPVGTAGTALKVCKPCYVRHSQGLPILSSPYEHVRPAKSERAGWSNDRDTSNRETSSERWDNERTYNGDERDGSQRVKRALRERDDNRCDDCGVKFENSDDAENHRNKEHGTSRGSANTYTCIQCQMSFPTEETIRQHVRKVHLESSNKSSMDALRCHLCAFEANSPLQLQGHLIEHTFAGCAGLTCYICQGLFTTPIALQNHMLQQHGLGARPYDCSYCGLKFFFRIELDHHVVTIHRRNEISSPGFEVGQENGMEKRNATQVSEEPYEANSCSRSVTVKEEIVNSPEDKDINVDDNVEHNDELETKFEEQHLLEAKKESFSLQHGEEKIQS